MNAAGEVVVEVAGVHQAQVPEAACRNTLAPDRSPARLEVGVVEGLQGLAALRPEWEELLVASGAGVFNSFEWLYPWLCRIAPERKPWVLTARDPRGALVGLMALGWEMTRVAGRRVRRLAFLGESNVGSDYLDALARPGFEAAVRGAFVQALKAAQPGWDVLDLRDLRAEAPLVAALREAFGNGHHVCVESPRYLCPYEPLSAGEPFDAFLRRTGRRDNYLRRRKWLEKQPGYRIQKSELASELPRAMGEFFRLHEARWDVDGGSQGIQGPRVEAFHRDATQLLAERGRVRMYTMWLGERAVASVYGILHANRFLYYQSGYDPELRSKSVGLVLVGETFKDALEEGRVEYDFLRGTESYKADWTTQRRSTVALRIYAKGSAGAWYHRMEAWRRQGRDAAKALLPGNLTERIRRLRRKGAALT